VPVPAFDAETLGPPRDVGGPARDTSASFKSPKPVRYFRFLLVFSLLGNTLALTGLAYIIRGRGGIEYLRRIFTHEFVAAKDVGYIHRESLFQALSQTTEPGSIVFLGDSITSECEWNELFDNDSRILNRGIGGDTSAGVLKRIETVTALKPTAIFLMIGTNDHQLLNLSPAMTIANYRAILQRIHELTPGTVVYLQSLLPTRAPRFNRWRIEVNRGVRKLADGRTVMYLDICDRFLEGEILGRRFSEDGIHLSGEGYLVWKNAIAPAMVSLRYDLGRSKLRRIVR